MRPMAFSMPPFCQGLWGSTEESGEAEAAGELEMLGGTRYRYQRSWNGARLGAEVGASGGGFRGRAVGSFIGLAGEAEMAGGAFVSDQERPGRIFGRA